MGDNFWDINAAEWFATAAILITAGIAIYNRRRNKRAVDKLIWFPECWEASYDQKKNAIFFSIGVNVLIRWNAYRFIPEIKASGIKITEIQNEDTIVPLNTELQRKGRISYWGEIPITSLPAGVNSLDMKFTIILDEKIKRTSNMRHIPIQNINLLTSDIQGSGPQ